MRITKKDRETYNKLRSSIVRKIRNTKNKYNIDLSNEINLKPLKEMNRGEFNAFKEQARIMLKGVPRYTFVKLNDHLSVNKIQHRRYIEAQKKAEQKAKKRFDELKDKPFFDNNKRIMDVGTYVQTMKNPDIPGINAPRSMDIEDITRLEYMEKKTQELERYNSPRITDEREQRLKENYITALKKEYGDYAVKLIDKIQMIEPSDFVELYAINNDVDIFNIYHSDVNAIGDIVENIIHFIDEYQKGLVDMSFKKARENAAD